MKHKINKYIGAELTGFQLEDENSGTLTFNKGEIYFCCDIKMDSDDENLDDVLSRLLNTNASIFDASQNNEGGYELVFGDSGDVDNKTTIQFFVIEGGGFDDEGFDVKSSLKLV